MRTERCLLNLANCVRSVISGDATSSKWTTHRKGGKTWQIVSVLLDAQLTFRDATGRSLANSKPPWRVFDEATEPVALGRTRETPSPQLDVRLTHKLHYPYTGERHEYTLLIEIENKGPSKVSDFRVDVWFPKQFLDVVSYALEVPQEETETHKLIRRSHVQFSNRDHGPLYTGDVRRDDLIEYSVTGERYHNAHLMDLPVRVIVFADGMDPIRVEKPLRSLQEF